MADREISDLENFSDYKFDAALITNPTSEHISTAIKRAEYPDVYRKPLKES